MNDLVTLAAEVVDIQPLAYMLEDLLYEAGDEGLEVCLAESPYEGSSLRDEALYAEYTMRYRRAVETVQELRGEPTFTGGPDEPARPPWHRADHLSCWSSAAGIIYVALESEVGWLRVLGGARAHPVERDTITLLPSSG